MSYQDTDAGGPERRRREIFEVFTNASSGDGMRTLMPEVSFITLGIYTSLNEHEQR